MYPGVLKGQKDQSHLFRKQRYSDVDIVIRRATQPGTCSGSDGDSPSSEDSHVNTMTSSTDQLPWRNMHPWASQLQAQWARRSSAVTDREQGTAEKPDDSIVLEKFPGHMAVLSQSDYFDSQVLLNFDDGNFTGSRPTLYVSVDDASHVPAVEAIIAKLYGAKDSLSKIPQHQVVHVIRYADMMQLDLVLQDAVQLLVNAAEGLTKDTLQILSQMTWSDCMLPVLPAFTKSAVGTSGVQNILVSLLGNLEAVWAEEKLSSMLLKLPLGAMQILLSLDQLQVYSEDTVMYTAARYVTAQSKEQQPEASKQLSQLVRAPHLSDFQLTAQAVNGDRTAFNIMQPHKLLLQQLLTLKCFGAIVASEVARLLPAAPQSWQLPARHILPSTADGVVVLWHLPMSELITAYNRCRENNCLAWLASDSVTAPISGTTWTLELQCIWDEVGNGVKVGVFSSPASYPHGVIYKQVSRIEWPEVDHVKTTSSALVLPQSLGWRDFFGCGALQGPFEESAWVDKGLPVTGNIELKLTVYEVL